jgi:hypothetical protein
VPKIVVSLLFSGWKLVRLSRTQSPASAKVTKQPVNLSVGSSGSWVHAA